MPALWGGATRHHNYTHRHACACKCLPVRVEQLYQLFQKMNNEIYKNFWLFIANSTYLCNFHAYLLNGCQYNECLGTSAESFPDTHTHTHKPTHPQTIGTVENICRNFSVKVRRHSGQNNYWQICTYQRK